MSKSIVPVDRIARTILVLRGEKVLLDVDLARLYGVIAGKLNKAVQRNRERFPADFMFQLTAEEARNLKFQFGISSWGGLRTRPYAFTEQGVAMLSSVLKSKRAIQVNIAIMRAFVRIRQVLSAHKNIAQRIDDLETKYRAHDAQLIDHAEVFQELKKLLAAPTPQPVPRKNRIGFPTGKSPASALATTAR